MTKRGDVVEYTGTDRPMTLDNGYGDWNADFADVQAGLRPQAASWLDAARASLEDALDARRGRGGPRRLGARCSARPGRPIRVVGSRLVAAPRRGTSSPTEVAVAAS